MQEGVDEWVSGCLAVGQTLGEDGPVRADWPRVEQLHNSESSQTEEKTINMNMRFMCQSRHDSWTTVINSLN